MSQEFEKEVLKKLNSIDRKLDEHTEILNEHTETLKGHTEILNEHTETLKGHTEILNEHTVQFKKIGKDIYEINNKIIKGIENMKELEKVVEFNTKTIKKINEENGKKIDISLKAYQHLNGKVEMNKCLITVLESKNFENDVRITALEDTIKQKGITA